MKCDKCGKDIPEQINYYPSCKVNEKAASERKNINILKKMPKEVNQISANPEVNKKNKGYGSAIFL